MLYLSSINGDNFGVTDTSDGVEEIYHKDKLGEICAINKIDVVGLSVDACWEQGALNYVSIKSKVPEKLLVIKESEMVNMSTMKRLNLVKEMMPKVALGDALSARISGDCLVTRFAGGIENWVNSDYEKIGEATPDVCDADEVTEEGYKNIRRGIAAIRQAYGLKLTYCNSREKGYGVYEIDGFTPYLGTTASKQDITVIEEAMDILEKVNARLLIALGVERNLEEIRSVWDNVIKYKRISHKQKKYVLLAYLLVLSDGCI